MSTYLKETWLLYNFMVIFLIIFCNANLQKSTLSITCTYLNVGRHGRDGIVVGFTTTCAKAVPITTKVVSLNPVHGKVYSIQHYVINLSVTCIRSVVFSGYSSFFHQ